MSMSLPNEIISRVKRTWDFLRPGAPLHKPLRNADPLIKMNLPPLMGRRDAAYDCAVKLFSDDLFAREEAERSRLYTIGNGLMQQAAEQTAADIILVDIGPNLGAINRSVLIATDFVVIPLGADLYSLQGLKNLGPTLRSWRDDWARRCANWEERKNKSNPAAVALRLPPGRMQPLGYLCQQYGVRLERPVKAYDKWVQRIPAVYREKVLGEENPSHIRQEDDPCCLATIKHYRSLIPMGQEHRKPIFDLTSADGAIGSHANAVRAAREDFATLADTIWDRMDGPSFLRNRGYARSRNGLCGKAFACLDAAGAASFTRTLEEAFPSLHDRLLHTNKPYDNNTAGRQP